MKNVVKSFVPYIPMAAGMIILTITTCMNMGLKVFRIALCLDVFGIIISGILLMVWPYDNSELDESIEF